MSLTMTSEVSDGAGPTPVGSGNNRMSSVMIDKDEQSFRRLLPRHLPRSANHIYVTTKTDYKNQLFRGITVLSSEEEFVVVHGLGTGIERAINLAHEIKNAVPAASIASCTSVIYVNEDLAFMLDGDPQTRTISILHMKILKPAKQDDDKSSLEVKENEGH